MEAEHEIPGMFANPSSSWSQGQVWHTQGLFFPPRKTAPSTQNLAVATMALVEHSLLHGL